MPPKKNVFENAKNCIKIDDLFKNLNQTNKSTGILTALVTTTDTATEKQPKQHVQSEAMSYIRALFHYKHNHSLSSLFHKLVEISANMFLHSNLCRFYRPQL